MELSQNDWLAYVRRLSRINNKAAEEMAKFIKTHGVDDARGMIDFAYAIATKYGEASAALSAEMYDIIAVLEKVSLPAAEMAATAGYGEVAKTINGILKTSVNENLLSDAVGRLVKQTGADTTLKNARRDHAEFAWIPVGDTCPYCRALASRGWQDGGGISNGHAEHIHANCDCTYSVRHTKTGGVAGYNPDEYFAEYMAADGRGSKAKINAMRRELYAQNKDIINAQKREAYRLRMEAKG